MSLHKGRILWLVVNIEFLCFLVLFRLCGHILLFWRVGDAREYVALPPYSWYKFCPVPTYMPTIGQTNNNGQSQRYRSNPPPI